ncbi:hypothetical protein H072_3967 [Dactylellina haptotyla CBS 200.50]|uniref:Uncharacterized protein n=1 Tax=Dactylellina haptotyla (strain CBS 200.50) TaxID=1284197 RepID=S8AGD2_DACHA|nr:hypothetical protein H072_3967 [Dactylellina haptotyla CBS 200.50]
MPPASPPPIPASLLRNHSTVSSSPFDNAPGSHYLQELDPEPEPEPEDPLIPASPRNRAANFSSQYKYNPRSRHSSGSSQKPISPSKTYASSRPSHSFNSPSAMPYGVPSFHHSAGTPGNPYNYNYNPSDVELSTIGMGMSMYETLNPLAATAMLSPPLASGRNGKRGIYAPIDASYYSAYTAGPPTPLSPYGNGVGGGPVGESVYGTLSTAFGFGTQSVNPRYISGKSEGAVNDGAKGREAAMRRVKRDADVFEEELKKLVQAQEMALGITPPGGGPALSPTASVYTSRSGAGRRKMGIKEVRRGILDAMVGLADVKAVEEEWYSGELNARVELVDIVDRWIRKREKLEKDVERVEGGPEGKEMDKVRERLEGVEEQIRIHEAEVKRLKAEQASMLAKISDLQSTLSSRLSSYTTSIQKMSKDMTDFLRSPNALLPTPDTKATLPFTPEQAIEYWRDERGVLDGKKKDTSRELDALKDGILIWQETVGLIADFEDMMARELVEAQREAQREAQKRAATMELERRKLDRSRSPQVRTSVFSKLDDGRPGSSSASSGRNTPVSVFANRNRNRGGLGHSRNGSLSSSTETFKPSGTPTTGASGTASATPKIEPQIPEDTALKLIAGIDNIISQLNSRLTIAEQRGWTLLVCVLGAEMESYKEARSTLLPLAGGLVDTSTTSEAVEKVKNKGKGKGKANSNGLASPSDDALNESLNGLNIGGHGYDGGHEEGGNPSQSSHQNHWNSESESEVDDPAALFGAEHTDNGGDSSPELRMSPRMRRIRAMSEEEDELEYAAFASLNLRDEGNVPTPTAATADGGFTIGGGRGSGRSTIVGEGVKKVGKRAAPEGKGEGADDIHGAFLERRDSDDQPPLI